jgi:septal ring factor EnvC (AmiA/AmiB activator)
MLANCTAGVSQEEYERVNSELATAQAQIESLENDLSTAQEQIETLENDYEEAQNDLQDSQDKVEALEEKIKQAKAQAEVINGLFVPALTGELDIMTEEEAINYFLDWRDKVEASGDPTLKEMFQELIDSGFADDQMMDFFLYLFESIPDTLEG